MTNSDAPEVAPKPPTPALAEETPIETHHELALEGRTLRYTAAAGRLPLRNDKGEIEANVFHVAYTLDDPPEGRPLMFVFNGGPGSSSVWLHLGAVGPRRVRMHDEGWLPAPPYVLEPNAQSWLEMADLVFIDPVGTGFSRAANEDLNRKFWNPKGDIESVGEIIRLYLARHKRWTSPLFLAGESYGTTRAAGLAGYLTTKGIALNGVILVSTILNFQTARFVRGNDLPYALFLPTYTAAAHYHRRLPADLLERPLPELLAEVEAWAAGDYTLALMQGDRLQAEERRAVVERLARYTGLTERYIEQTNLRVNIMRFCKELLRDEDRTVGRLDSRFMGIDTLDVTEFPDFDPSLQAITPPYTMLLNHYARAELGYESDLEYEVLSSDINQKWEWDRGVFMDTSEALRNGLARNPFMRVFVAQGYYDLATPHFAVDYTLNHMDIDPALHANIETKHYESGHMVYLEVGALAQLKADVADFIARAAAGP